MLYIFRKKAQGLMAWCIILLVAGAFVFFGVSNYFSFGSHSTTAAMVNGEKISWVSIDNIYERVAQQYGGQISEKALKEQILMAVVQRAALISKAKTLGFRVGEEQVGGFLLQIPAFQVDGKFSKEQYLKVLKEASYTDAGFRQELSQDVLLGQLEQGFVQSSFMLENELQNNVALLDQKRDFGYMLIPAQNYKKSVTLTADEIKSYYEEHKSTFIKPERVALEYVEISLEQLASQIKPTKEEILAFYEEHQTAYTTPERVHARHILITAPQGDESLNAKAKEKAESLLKRLTEGADFQKLAMEVSEDVGSAEQGGDLGWFVRGQMVPEFEKAAFALEPGNIGGPVRTQFGYHLIQLMEHKDAEVRPFEEVKNLVEEQFKREKSEVIFAEKKEGIAKLAFEQATTLAPIAEQFGLKIQETELFDRSGGKKGNTVTTHPDVIKMAFSEAVLGGGRNSELMKLSENLTAVFRVKKHEPAVQQTLAEAEPQIQEHLVTEKAKIKIKEMGENMVKALSNGAKPMQIAKEHQLKWIERSNVIRTPSDIDRAVVATAFQMTLEPQSKQSNVKGFLLPNGDYLVLTLNKIHPGDFAKLDAATQRSYRQGLIEVSSQFEYALYASQALRDTKVEFAKAPS